MRLSGVNIIANNKKRLHTNYNSESVSTCLHSLEAWESIWIDFWKSTKLKN